MLVLGGAFVILRAAISHDECSRRFDGLHQELESSNTRLKEFSFTDDVTGLYNRRFFATRLEDEVSRYSRFNQPLSVVMLDIDGFKAVNDELGHAAGDETLRIVGHILQRQSRNIDVICRYGGDEFAVLLVETGKDGALLYAERVRRQIEAAAFGHGRTITVSLGVACLPEDVGAVPRGHRHRRGLGALRGQARGQEPGRGTGRGRRHREGPARRLGPVSAVADRPSVLIVDDERMIRELLGDIFTAGGYQCRLATNGMEAIEAFQAERPALSVTDIRMPVLDGMGFLKQALALDPDAAVLVLTGVGDVKTAVELLNGRRLRLHPEAGGSGTAASHRRPRARAAPARRRAPPAPGAAGAAGDGSDERARRHRAPSRRVIPGHARGARLGHRHARRRHARPLAPRARLLARHRPRPRRARIPDARHRARRAAPRHRQDRHSRRHPPQAGCRSRRRSGW